MPFARPATFGHLKAHRSLPADRAFWPAGSLPSPVIGGNGDDLIYGNMGGDLLLGEAGTDQIFGGQDNDTLYGGDGNDSLFGNLGDDLLYGDNATNSSGAGVDVINGGLGTDTAVFLNSRSGYSVVFQFDGGIVIGGNDVLYGIEFVQFADQLVPVGLL